MKGLILSEQQVKAWKAGRLSVVRKLMKPQPNMDHHWAAVGSYRFQHKMMDCSDGPCFKCWHHIDENPEPDGVQWIKPPYRTGETVYVKETLYAEMYAARSWTDLSYADRTSVNAEIPEDWSPPWNTIRTHWESGDNIPGGGFAWYTATIPSIFMPEWASRGKIIIGDVRPEKEDGQWWWRIELRAGA